MRDLLLAREADEVDVAVDGDAGEIARELEARGRGRAVLLSGDRRPRVYRVAGRGRTLDIAELEGGSIETDLARRDFTVNAMAAELPSARLLDPSGGVADLAARRLTMVSEKNLFDDPLRALRAARLVATHALRPDRGTGRAVRRAAPLLAGVAEERVQAELAKLLEAPRAAPALSWAASSGLLAPALKLPLPDLLWRRIARTSAALDSAAVARLPRARRARLRLAYLAGRAGLSPVETASWLRRLRWGSAEAVEVSRLIGLARSASRAAAGEGVWRWLYEAGDRAADALALASILDPRSRPALRSLRARVARRRPIPDVRGADVLDWLEIPEGPAVGRLLEAVRIEALAGRVRTRADARNWLRRHGAKSLNAIPL